MLDAGFVERAEHQFKHKIRIVYDLVRSSKQSYLRFYFIQYKKFGIWWNMRCKEYFDISTAGTMLETRLMGTYIGFYSQEEAERAAIELDLLFIAKEMSKKPRAKASKETRVVKTFDPIQEPKTYDDVIKSEG